MSLIAIGNVIVPNILLNDIQVTNVYIGDVLVWSNYDCDNKLLDELGRPFVGIIHGDDNEKLITIDAIEA